MKFDVLKSVAHNIATAVSDGGAGMFGSPLPDIHAEASERPPGYILVDFLRGSASGSRVSRDLKAKLSQSPKVLRYLCSRHGIDIFEIAELTARYGVDPVYGSHFTVTVASGDGKRSIDLYEGLSGRRLRRGVRTDRQLPA